MTTDEAREALLTHPEAPATNVTLRDRVDTFEAAIRAECDEARHKWGSDQYRHGQNNVRFEYEEKLAALPILSAHDQLVDEHGESHDCDLCLVVQALADAVLDATTMPPVSNAEKPMTSLEWSLQSAEAMRKAGERMTEAER